MNYGAIKTQYSLLHDAIDKVCREKSIWFSGGDFSIKPLGKLMGQYEEPGFEVSGIRHDYGFSKVWLSEKEVLAKMAKAGDYEEGDTVTLDVKALYDMGDFLRYVTVEKDALKGYALYTGKKLICYDKEPCIITSAGADGIIIQGVYTGNSCVILMEEAQLAIKCARKQ